MIVNDTEVKSYKNQSSLILDKKENVSEERLSFYSSSNSKYLKRVKLVGNKIVKNIKNLNMKITYSLINDNKVNAHIMPWGEIRVHKGLLKFAKKDEHLAIVLAHEIAHITQNHFQEIEENIKKNSTSKIKNTHNLNYNNDTTNLLKLRLELEADNVGLEYLYKSGYDPLEGIKFIRKLAKYSSNKNSKSHPSFELRLKNLNDWYPILRKKYKKLYSHKR